MTDIPPRIWDWAELARLWNFQHALAWNISEQKGREFEEESKRRCFIETGTEND